MQMNQRLTKTWKSLVQQQHLLLHLINSGGRNEGYAWAKNGVLDTPAAGAIHSCSLQLWTEELSGWWAVMQGTCQKAHRDGDYCIWNIYIIIQSSEEQGSELTFWGQQ